MSFLGGMMGLGMTLPAPREEYGDYHLSVQTRPGTYSTPGKSAELALFTKDDDWVLPQDFPPELHKFRGLFEGWDSDTDALDEWGENMSCSVAGHVPLETVDEIRAVLKKLQGEDD